jgi:hypothetical protein
VLLLSHSTDGVPIDIFLGSMASEMCGQVRAAVAPEVVDFFTNGLPHPGLALLVFAEFVPVDAAPVVASLAEEGGGAGTGGS